MDLHRQGSYCRLASGDTVCSLVLCRPLRRSIRCVRFGSPYFFVPLSWPACSARLQDWEAADPPCGCSPDGPVLAAGRYLVSRRCAQLVGLVEGLVEDACAGERRPDCRGGPGLSTWLHEPSAALLERGRSCSFDLCRACYSLGTLTLPHITVAWQRVLPPLTAFFPSIPPSWRPLAPSPPFSPPLAGSRAVARSLRSALSSIALMARTLPPAATASASATSPAAAFTAHDVPHAAFTAYNDLNHLAAALLRLAAACGGPLGAALGEDPRAGLLGDAMALRDAARAVMLEQVRRGAGRMHALVTPQQTAVSLLDGTWSYWRWGTRTQVWCCACELRTAVVGWW